MPIYDYKCKDCGTTYDVLHKGREVAEDVVCPSCGSANSARLIGVSTFSMSSRTSHASTPPPSCSDGTCCGGSCGLN